MHFRFIKTGHALLRNYLEGFYILHVADSEVPLRYLVFPSNHITISVHKNTTHYTSDSEVTIAQKNTTGISSLITTTFNKPICCTYKGMTHEITFCFKPLGINQFLENDLNSYSGRRTQSFFPFANYEPAMRNILEEQDERLLQLKIENYWLSKLKEKNFTLLTSCIDKITNNHDSTLNDIAKSLETSRQHICRLFNIHLCKTPTEFKKVNRFRQTLQKRIQYLKQTDNLTSLTYESFFYDQSHLIKDFKSLTGMNPKKFFMGNRAFENGNINWFFH